MRAAREVYLIQTFPRSNSKLIGSLGKGVAAQHGLCALRGGQEDSQPKCKTTTFRMLHSFSTLGADHCNQTGGTSELPEIAQA